ncbi:MAG: adaptor protein MecA [Clostridia bacterium]|nr:adaptor protein MecA [Clostridia bacterium]
MLVKVLDENRVKILMEDQDIEQYDLPFEKLNYDDPYSRAFIYNLIEKTYDQTGLNFRDSRLIIEVVPGFSRSYYILLTKIEKEGEEKIEFDKSESVETEMYVFRLECGYDVLQFIKQIGEFYPEKSALYLLNDHFYLTLSFGADAVKKEEFGRYIKRLEEFGFRCRYHYANESILKEWGMLIAGPDVVMQLNK